MRKFITDAVSFILHLPFLTISFVVCSTVLYVFFWRT